MATMKRSSSPLRATNATTAVGTAPAIDDVAAAKQSIAGLYQPWFDLMPAFFGVSAPTAPSRNGAAQNGGDGAGAAFPVDLMMDALQRTEHVLGPLFHQFAQALSAGSAKPSRGDPADAPVDGYASPLMALFAPFEQAMSVWPLSAVDHSAGWSEALTRRGHGAAPAMTGAERTFGAVADALGLAPSREILDAQRTLASAALERQQARTEYLTIVGKILSAGARNLRARLTELAGRGDTVDSVSALIRQWAKATDEAAHVALQSDEGLSASVKMIRAGMRYREASHRLVAIASEAINVPTRVEVDEAYRHIQELKREVRRLRRSVAALERGGSSAKPKDTPT